MITKICTDIGQSKKLIELGVDVITADMRYSPLNPDIPWVWVGKPLIEKDAVPAWSLSALLEQLPYELVDEEGNSYNLQMNKDDDLYQIIYHDRWGYLEDLETESYEDFIDACVEMIIKLHKQKLL